MRTTIATSEETRDYHDCKYGVPSIDYEHKCVCGCGKGFDSGYGVKIAGEDKFRAECFRNNRHLLFYMELGYHSRAIWEMTSAENIKPL